MSITIAFHLLDNGVSTVDDGTSKYTNRLFIILLLSTSYCLMLNNIKYFADPDKTFFLELDRSKTITFWTELSISIC